MHRARDCQRSRHAEAHGDRAQPVRPIELEVLARVQDVEAAHPQPDRERRAATAPIRPARPRRASRRRARPPWRGRETPACRRCTASRASTRTRSPARPATARGTGDSTGRPRRRTRSTTMHDPHRSPRGGVIAPRGSSRIAVRGFSASNRASTRRLNPIAALRALTMATMIHTTCDQVTGVHARGQQRARQRKRQREHRVAEADERRHVWIRPSITSSSTSSRRARARSDAASPSAPAQARCRPPGIPPHRPPRAGPPRR